MYRQSNIDLIKAHDVERHFLVSYLEWIAYLLAIYYAVILIVYYRNGILSTLLQRQQSSVAAKNQFQVSSRLSNSSRNHHSTSYAVHDLLEELKTVFQQAVENRYLEEDFLFALHGKMVHYKILHKTFFQLAVNGFIMEQAVLQCDMILEEDKIKSCWINT